MNTLMLLIDIFTNYLKLNFLMVFCTMKIAPLFFAARMKAHHFIGSAFFLSSNRALCQPPFQRPLQRLMYCPQTLPLPTK
jgi:hypothetical protein